MRHLLDGHAAEEAEGGQAGAALDRVGVAERLARPQQQLPPDRLGVGAHRADDQHAIDDHLRPLAQGEANVGGGVVVGERDGGLDQNLVVATVAVLQLDAVARADDVDLRERPARRQRRRGTQRILGHDRVAFERHGADDGSRPLRDLQHQLDAALVVDGSLGHDDVLARRDRDAGEATEPVGAAHVGHPEAERLLGEDVALRHTQQLANLGGRHRGVPGHPHAGHLVARPAIDREGDDDLVVLWHAVVVHARIAPALALEERLDGARRVLEQIFVGRRLGADRHQPLAIVVVERVAAECHADLRALRQRDADHGAVGQEQDAVARARLVVTAGAQPVGPALQLALDSGPVVGGAAAQIGGFDQRDAVAAVGVGDAEILDQRAGAGRDREDQRRAIRVVRFLDPRHHRRLRVAAVAIGALQRLGGAGGLRRARSRTQLIHDQPPQVVLVHGERALEGDAVDRVRRHQHVTNQHAARRRGFLQHADVLEGVQPDQVRHGLAHVAHRQRLARGGLQQIQDDCVGDDAALALDDHLGDGRSGGVLCEQRHRPQPGRGRPGHATGRAAEAEPR